MRVSVIVLAYNGAAYLDEALRSLQPLPAGWQLLVVDNGSHDSSVAIARQAAPSATLVENGANYGFSGGMNIGLRLALGLERRPGLELQPSDVLVLLNQDTCCLPGWHQAIVAPLADRSIGAAGCKIYDHDGATILHVGGYLEPPRALAYHMGHGELDRGQHEQLRDVEYATGAALALRADVLAQVGLFDERYNPAYMEEVDLCERIRLAGYRVVVNPAARVIHYESSSGSNMALRKYWHTRGRLLYLIKHRPLDELLGVFAEQEQAGLEGLGGDQDLRVLKRAYLDAIVRLPDWCRARAARYGPPTRPEYEQLLGMLARLRRRCTQVDFQALA